MYRLLIAEDEPLERKALRKIIGGAFADIELLPDATNGREAVAGVGRFDPDILLLDIQMPYLSGIEVLKSLRAGGYPGEIIILTAHDEFGYVKDALNHGANAFLLKPETRENIIRAVGESTGRLRQTRQRQMTQQQKENILAGMADYIARETILRLVDGETLSPEMLRQLDELGIEFSTGFFVIVELRQQELEKAAPLEEQRRELLEKARAAVKDALHVDGKVIVSPVRGGGVFGFSRVAQAAQHDLVPLCRERDDRPAHRCAARYAAADAAYRRRRGENRYPTFSRFVSGERACALPDRRRPARRGARAALL